MNERTNEWTVGWMDGWMMEEFDVEARTNEMKKEKNANCNETPNSEMAREEKKLHLDLYKAAPDSTSGGCADQSLQLLLCAIALRVFFLFFLLPISKYFHENTLATVC